MWSFNSESNESSEKPMSSRACGMLTSGILGAGLMFFVDPRSGRRRRALVRDKLIRAGHELEDAVEVSARDLWHRTYGTAAELRNAVPFLHNGTDDYILVDRVRSKMGRVVSHPHAIQVAVIDGMVTLRGDILADEVDDFLAAVKRVSGVRGVHDELIVHKQRGTFPALQGGSPRPGDRYQMMQENWAPGPRMLATLGGAALALYGLAHRGLAGSILTLFGSTLAVRGVTNLELKRLTGISAGRRGVDIQKTININAPIDKVFGYFSNYQNFPLFMRNVREVRDHGNGQSHWTVAGPAGIPIQWDATLTSYEPCCRISWKTLPNQTVAHAGTIRFDECPDGSTRVDVKLSYNPPAGAIGHALATLFGADPRHELNQDLLRAKTFIETGHCPHDAAQHAGTMATTAV